MSRRVGCRGPGSTSFPRTRGDEPWDEDEGMWYEVKTDFGYWNHILYTDPGEACDLGTAIEVDYFENLPVEMLDPVLQIIRDYQVDEDGNESDQKHWFARWEESK